jgi:predicted RNA binding protein YcfA (HicA-like mRNA interferase family)
MKPHEMIKFLESEGYSFLRQKGTSHSIYSNGVNSVPLPIHGGCDYGSKFIGLLLNETGISKKKLLKFLKR